MFLYQIDDVSFSTQSERDSFINGKNGNATLCPALMPIKQEMTESSGALLFFPFFNFCNFIAFMKRNFSG